MVSDIIVDFRFFIKFHRSGPAKICSFWTITDHVSYQSKKVHNQAKIDLDFIKMVSITLEGLWMVSDRIVDFQFFVKFHRSGPAKIFSFWTITEHVSYQSNNVPNQAKIDLDFIKMVSITLEGLWMVSDRIVDFRFFAKFHRSGHAKICSFWTCTEHVSYQSKKVSNPAKIDQDFMKMVSITLQGLWMVSDRIVDFRLFVKFYRSGLAKIFSFWTITEHVSYPSKKVPNQAKNYLDFIKMVSTTLEGLWMISDRIVDFRFFIKFHRSGPAKMYSSWTTTEHVSYQSKKVPNPAKIYLDFIKMVNTTVEGLWMVSDRIVDFKFFVKFHRSGPAKIFSFWTITEHVSYQLKKVPNHAKIALDFKKMVSITLDGFWMVSDRIVDFWFFVKFHRSGPAKIFSFWTITEHVSYQSKKVPNQAKIDLDFIKMVSITLERFWMVSDRIVDFWFFVKFHRYRPAKIFSFWTITEHVSYQSKKVPNQAKIDLDFIKMVSITLERFWMVSDRIVDFWFFVKFHRYRPAKICSFWTITDHVSYQSKKVPNQAKNYLDFIKMVSITLEGLSIVSDRIVDFQFFVKFHRSGPAKMCSSWTITEHVSYQSKKVHNHANIDLDFMKMVSITLEGLWMVSDRIVDFKFFVKFHRSGPAKLFSFWTITEHVSYPLKKVPNKAKIDLDFIKMVSITLEGL